MLGFRRATCPRVSGQGPMPAHVAATWMVGRRNQANRATVPPAQLAMLPRLDAQTRPARSETMAVVRSKAISADTRLTSDAPYKACSGFTRVTARWIAQPPRAAFVTRLQPSQLPDQTARQLPEQSTTLRVEPSSTGDTRRRGAPGNPGLDVALGAGVPLPTLNISVESLQERPPLTTGDRQLVQGDIVHPR